jgi:pimeloyl-ACP methyl ester carboxylesterase
MEVQVSLPCEGEAIFGVLHLPSGGPVPGVVMCHGFTGHKAETHRLFVNAARDFAGHGLAVLRFDFRGSGDSGGEFREMTISREIADAKAALDYLCSRSEVDASRVGVLGLSMGGCVAACLAGRDARVKALVLWAALAHPGRITARLLPDFGDKESFDMNGWEIGRAFVEDGRSVDPLEEIRRYAGPALIVHGSQDETVPPSDADEYREALGARSKLHLVEGAGHVFSSVAWKAEAIALSRDFLTQALAVRR